MDKMILIENCKKYILTNVTSEMYEKQKQSCDLCDYYSKPINCGIYNKYKCPSNHCYKLVKEDNTIMDNKGKCPKCGSESFATERRPDGNSVCGNCNYVGKTTEFYPKYKLNDLCFKVITGSIKRNEAIASLFTKITKQDIIVNSHATYVLIIASKICCSYDNIDNSNTAIKEITFEEAVKLLESCEVEIPETKESSGRFVEYDINEHGFLVGYQDEDNLSYHWQDPHVIETNKCIFAGWLWDNPENKTIEPFWSNNRMGVFRKQIISLSQNWEYPLVPTKIRFWVKY